MFKEFKEFAMKGSVMDLAVGVVIGAAFGKVVASLVTDIVMPPIGLLLGHANFSNLFISLNGKTYDTLEAAKAAGAATINYGLFLNTLIEFLIVALTIFLVVRMINKWRVKPAAPATRDCPYCITAVPLRATRCPACTSELKPA